MYMHITIIVRRKGIKVNGERGLSVSRYAPTHKMNSSLIEERLYLMKMVPEYTYKSSVVSSP